MRGHDRRAMSPRIRPISAPTILFACLMIAGSRLGTCPALAAEPAPSDRLTLEQALDEAHRANVDLPVADFDTRIARQRQVEAEARRRLQVRLDGDLWLAPSAGYDPVVTNLGEERVQVAVEKLLYDGGARRADVARTRAELAASQARFRMAEEDLALEVRQQFAAVLASESEAQARRDGIARLESYVKLLEERESSGQPVTADLLRARVRLATDRAALAAAEETGDQARASLATLLGRAPEAPLALAALPVPQPPAPVRGPVAATTPDVEATTHDVSVAEAALQVASAEGRPQVTARADAGLWGSDTTALVPADFAAAHPGANFGDRLSRDLGYSFTIGFTLPLFDGGEIAARNAAAQMELEQARQRLKSQSAAVELQLVSARKALERTYRQYELLSQAVPQSRDAYLLTESRYRGGASSSVEVLDAFSATIDTAVAAVQAELAYRTAQALVLRWGGNL
jgi:outer membrane protein TolC